RTAGWWNADRAFAVKWRRTVFRSAWIRWWSQSTTIACYPVCEGGTPRDARGVADAGRRAGTGAADRHRKARSHTWRRSIEDGKADPGFAHCARLRSSYDCPVILCHVAAGHVDAWNRENPPVELTVLVALVYQASLAGGYACIAAVAGE